LASERKRLENKLDKLFRDAVRTRDKWTCTVCGKYYEPPTKALHCSHFIGRAERATRWDLLNADAHCYYHHSQFEQHPHKFTEWKKEKIGLLAYDDLVLRGNKGKNWTLQELEDHIESLEEYLVSLDDN